MKLRAFTIIALIFAGTIIAGCDSNRDRREFFKKPRIMTDSQGGKWLIEHHIGDTYSVTSLDIDEVRTLEDTKDGVINEEKE